MLHAYVERFDVTFLKLNQRPQFIYLLKKKRVPLNYDIALGSKSTWIQPCKIVS